MDATKRKYRIEDLQRTDGIVIEKETKRPASGWIFISRSYGKRRLQIYFREGKAVLGIEFKDGNSGVPIMNPEREIHEIEEKNTPLPDRSKLYFLLGYFAIFFALPSLIMYLIHFEKLDEHGGHFDWRTKGYCCHTQACFDWQKSPDYKPPEKKKKAKKKEDDYDPMEYWESRHGWR